jgi:hypothetical protein
VGSFAGELPGAVAEGAQGFKGHLAEDVSRAINAVVPALVSVSENGSVARSAGSGAKVRSSVDE